MNLQEYKFPNITDAGKVFGTFNTVPELLAEAKARGFYDGDTPYNSLFSKLFFAGGKLNFKPNLPEDFKTNATRYLGAFMRSFAPKHEEKEAICALILSELVDIEQKDNLNMESESNYGFVKADEGNGEVKNIAITDFVRATYVDHRLITVASLEDDTIVLMVENPTSSGRATVSQMRLSPESFIGLVNTIFMHTKCKGVDLDSLAQSALVSDMIEFDFSDNLTGHIEQDGN